MVLSEPKLKMLFGEPLSGRRLAEYAVEISSKEIPVIKSAWDNICQRECEEVINEIAN